ncbi:MAG: hypothetical protein AAF645_25345 [Myxococcota bacterium]
MARFALIGAACVFAALAACDPTYIELLDAATEEGPDAPLADLAAQDAADASDRGADMSDAAPDAASPACVGSDCSACPTATAADGEATCGVACSIPDCTVGLADDGTRPVADCSDASRCGQPAADFRHCIGVSNTCAVLFDEPGEAACLDGFCRATCEEGPCRFQCLSGDCTLRCMSSPCELVDCPVDVVDCGGGLFACQHRCSG